MKNDRLSQLKQLLIDELKSEKPELLYIEDLKLSILDEELWIKLSNGANMR